MRSLLRKYTSVFSVHDGDLGCTNLIAHDIPLLDDVPVRQRYRCIPPSTARGTGDQRESQPLRLPHCSCQEEGWQSAHVRRLPPTEQQDKEGCLSSATH